MSKIKKKLNKITSLKTKELSVREPVEKYIVQREIELEEKKSKFGFNNLTPKEWALLSKNVINKLEIFIIS